MSGIDDAFHEAACRNGDYGSFTIGDYTLHIKRIDSYSLSDKGPGRHEFSIEVSGLVTETPQVVEVHGPCYGDRQIFGLFKEIEATP